MNGYLLDTNILSALAPTRPRPSPALAEWLEARTDRLFLSVISIVEIEAGISKLHRLGSKARSDGLATWMEHILTMYGDRVLPFDLAAGQIAGAMTDRARSSGSNPGFADIALAATAQRHELLVLTANVRHFEAIGASHANPFESLPQD